ncbi:hypothetical protein FPRO04_11350 [Fusarium proliferatum]|nr:hypothetical protein FPRO03_09996 [Fusarium proliferatum]KAG4271122.1 hypothetical protein FPRO04_11350 [Fusarium proliferatum]
MKSCIFATTLLGSAGIASAAEYPSMQMDTWCITYLSTYLAPISVAPGVSPSSHMTLFGNSLTATASITGGQTIIASELSSTSDLSSFDVGGLPTFYAGENYKALGVQDGDSFPQDAITKTFGTTGQNLIFKNSGLPNGEAGFCQDSSGQVYITFTASPPGCVPVTLGVYDVTQCQNGRLVGFETSTSASASSTEASTAESVSSGIFSSEEPTTAETAAPTEFTSSQTFGSVSSAACSRSVDASTSASGTEVFSTISSEEIIPPTSTFSSEASTTVTSQDADTSASVSSQAVDSETSTIVSSELFDSSVTIQSTLSSSDSGTEAPSSTELETSSSLASTSEEPFSTTTETSGDSTSETSSELASSSSEETTSESSTGITTTTADTTTDLITTTTSAAALSECRSDSNTYSDSGSTFDLSCDFSVDSGASIGVVQANSFNQCVFFCAQASNCAAIQYEKSTMNCSGFSSFTGTSANAQFDVAVKQP